MKGAMLRKFKRKKAHLPHSVDGYRCADQKYIRTHAVALITIATVAVHFEMFLLRQNLCIDSISCFFHSVKAYSAFRQNKQKKNASRHTVLSYMKPICIFPITFHARRRQKSPSIFGNTSEIY